jgi:hypothetical protein
MVGGDLNITGIKQEAIITVDFSCLNAFKAEQEMAQAMLSELVNDLQSQMSTQALNDMNTAAETQAVTSGIFGGSATADTTTVNSFNLSNVSTTNTAIQNVIANSIQSNFSVKSIQECINQTAINQKQDYSNCQVGGNLNASELEQKAGISTVVNCVNNSGTVSGVMSAVANKLNIAVASETTAEVSSTMTNTITTMAESIGFTGCPMCPCPGCGDPIGASIWCIVICCCICLILSSCIASLRFAMNRAAAKSTK